MHGFFRLQSVLIPPALFVSAAVAYPVWEHHTVRETSPVFAFRSAVERWAVAEKQAEGCLARTVDLKVISESGDDDTVRGPFFGTLRCHSPRIYARLAATLLLPLVLINIAVIGLRSNIKFHQPRKRR